MSLFIGIVPPPDVAAAISAIQQPFGDNRLEPHITIVPPIYVAEKADWLDALNRTCRHIEPFEVKLKGTGKFGKGVLFISLTAPRLAEVHEQLMLATAPFIAGGKNEKDRAYHPHLTLGRLWCGFTAEGFRAMKELASDYIAKSGEPFRIDFLRVYEKQPQQRYQKLTDLPFGAW